MVIAVVVVEVAAAAGSVVGSLSLPFLKLRLMLMSSSS